MAGHHLRAPRLWEPQSHDLIKKPSGIQDRHCDRGGPDNVAAWIAHYNEVHPHKALGYRSPREFIAAHARP